MNTQKKDFGPLHPGEVLLEEYLLPAGISQNRLALSVTVADGASVSVGDVCGVGVGVGKIAP
jgi:plasmid maintenance system antidote protein VapI